MADVFVLGAGFSKAIHPGMPTLEELSAEVIEKIRKQEFPIPEPLDDLDDNIELWITYLSQRQPWLDEVENDFNRSLAGRIRQHIGEIIDARIAKAAQGGAPEWLNSLIKSWHREKAVVISLNYDTLIERAARELKINDRVGRILSDQMYPPYFADVRARSGTARWGREPLETLSLLKLHGSTNWYYSGRDDFFGETILYSDVPPLGIDHAREEERLRLRSQDKSPLIIPPLTEKTAYFNNETVRRLWKEAGFALKDAKRVFIVGYSLPRSDLGMTFFFKRHFPKTTTPVYLVDTNPNVVSHYRSQLKLDAIGEFVGGRDPVEAFVQHYASRHG